jgi:hypothetical protein
MDKDVSQSEEEDNYISNRSSVGRSKYYLNVYIVRNQESLILAFTF